MRCLSAVRQASYLDFARYSSRSASTPLSIKKSMSHNHGFKKVKNDFNENVVRMWFQG